MEQVILRFPHLAEKIFAQLDNLSLTRCREVSKTWKSFLDQQKFLHIRCIQSYIENEKKDDIGDLWKKFFNISNTEMILLLKTAVENVYSNKAWYTEGILNPHHVAAIYGQNHLYKYIEEKLGDKSEESNCDMTPFHYAAMEGHLDVCKYIMEKTEDKNPRNSNGETPKSS